MQEKPVQKTSRLASASLCLAVLAILTLYPLTASLTMGVNYHFPVLGRWWDSFVVSGWIVPVSLGFGLLGVMAGSLALDQGKRGKWKAITGIVASSLAILNGVFFATIFMGLNFIGIQ
jgi:hypothetical protein